MAQRSAEGTWHVPSGTEHWAQSTGLPYCPGSGRKTFFCADQQQLTLQDTEDPNVPDVPEIPEIPGIPGTAQNFFTLRTVAQKFPRCAYKEAAIPPLPEHRGFLADS